MKKKSLRMKSGLQKDVVRRIIQVAALQLAVYAVLFILAGTLNWAWGWVFVMAGFLMLAANAVFLPPELIAERGRKKPNAKKWDKIINGLGAIPYAGIYVLAGLDRRFGWSGGMGTALHFSGLFLFLSGSIIFIWAMTCNPFFSTMVRIQSERGHKVASGGPYRIVRHPGYAGYILFNTGIPVLLGSIPAFLASLFLTVLVVIRTYLEDKTLQKELKGYKAYAKKVSFRLIPGLW